MERRIDRYRLLEEVGSGGMAVVYRAVDSSLGREVAVKVMHPHLAGREESRRRFSREARAVAKLHHPNIVEIWDFSGDEAPESFIVTEFVRGRTLRVFGEEVGARLPEIGALIADALAAALEHAHGHGVLHRDLKPENVMVSDAGELKLMDFGIARLLDGDEKMTMTGALVGSPLHMPPEVIEGRESDGRADIFSLGTLLYWLVTGRMAFQAKTTTLTLRQILEGDYEDPRLAAPACSDLLAEVIGRCLKRDPAERFGSMTELRAALAGVLDEAGIGEPAAEPEGRSQTCSPLLARNACPSSGPDPGRADSRTGLALRAFFADPSGYEAALRARLVARLSARGEAWLAQKRTPLALACFDRVLALEPGNEAVNRQLERLRRRQSARVRLRRLGAGAAVVVILALAAVGIGYRAESGPETTGAKPVGGAPAESDAALAPDEGVAVPTGESAPSSHASTNDAGPSVARGGKTAPPALISTDVATRTTSGDVPARTTPQRQVTIAWSPPGPGILLEVDGLSRDTAQAPFWEGTLPVGNHVVHVSRPDCCEPERQTIVVPPGDGELEPFRIALQPRPGYLVIRSPRDDLAVSVDGEPRGLLRAFPGGRVPVPLVVGSQRRYRREVEVTLASADGIHFSRTVVLRAGQESQVNVVPE